MGIVIDRIAVDKYEFESKILSEEECDKIKEELKKIEWFNEKVQCILNFYYNNKKLRFIYDSGIDCSLANIFIGNDMWIGFLIFEEMQ